MSEAPFSGRLILGQQASLGTDGHHCKYTTALTSRYQLPMHSNSRGRSRGSGEVRAEVRGSRSRSRGRGRGRSRGDEEEVIR